MYQLVVSRSFLIGQGNYQRRVIVPFGDMVNHSPANSNSEIVIDINNGVFSILSTGKIEEKNEVNIFRQTSHHTGVNVF